MKMGLGVHLSERWGLGLGQGLRKQLGMYTRERKGLGMKKWWRCLHFDGRGIMNSI